MAQCSQFIRRLTLEKNAPICRLIRKFTQEGLSIIVLNPAIISIRTPFTPITLTPQEKSPTGVTVVARPLVAAQASSSITGRTQGRNLTDARSAVNASFSLHNFRPIEEFTPERNHMYVKCVVRASFTVQVFKPIRESTQERNHTDAMSVGRPSG